MAIVPLTYYERIPEDADKSIETHSSNRKFILTDEMLEMFHISRRLTGGRNIENETRTIIKEKNIHPTSHPISNWEINSDLFIE